MSQDRHERGAHAAYLTFRRTGSPDAIARVFDLVAPQLHRLATRLTGDAIAADDLVQVTFLDAVTKAERFDDERALTPWLTGILVNHARHERRRRERRAWTALPESHSQPDEPDVLLANELADAIQRAVDHVPAAYRAVLHLRLQEDLGPTEIAARLSRPLETVRTQLTRGMSRLRAALPQSLAPALAPLWLEAGLAPAPAGTGLTVAREALREVARAGVEPITTAARPFDAGTATASASHRLPVAAASVASIVVAALVLVSFLATNRARVEKPVLDASSPIASGVGALIVREDPTPGHSRRSDVALEARPHVRVSWAGTAGAPAAGVTVALRPAGDSSWQREVRRATDETGLATFDATELAALASSWEVRTVPGPGSAVIHTLRELGRGARIELARGITVEGHARDASGAAIVGARIWSAAPGLRLDEGAVVAVTDAAGMYRFDGAISGSALGALADGFAPAPCVIVRPTAVAGRAQFGFQFVFGEATAPIAGLVVDSHGRPLAGAAVLIGRSVAVDQLDVFGGERGLGVPTRVRTDSRGRFRCEDQSPDDVPVWVAAAGHAPTRAFAAGVHADASAGRAPRTDVLVQLRPGTFVRGVVRRELADRSFGAPAASLDVQLEHAAFAPLDGPGWARITSTTTADGAFVVGPTPAGPATLLVQVAGAAAIRARRTVPATELFTWDVTLTATLDADGTLTGPGGDALAGWLVATRERDSEDSRGEQWYGDEWPRVAVTNHAGGFVVRGAHDGAEIELRVRDPHAANDVMPVTRALTIARDRPLAIRLSADELPSAALRIQVDDARGRPLDSVTGVLRRCVRDGTVATFAVAGQRADGSVTFGGLRAGRYEVGVLVDATQEIRHVGIFDLPAATTLDLPACVFQSAGHLEVRVLAPTGAGLDRGSLLVQPTGGTYRWGMPVGGGARGALALQPGAYRVSYTGAEGQPFCRDVDVRPGETTSVVVRLQPAALRWYRLDRIPRAFSLRTIEWFDASGERLVIETARLHPHHDAGRRIALADGAYRVVVTDAFGVAIETRIDLGPGDARRRSAAFDVRSSR